MANTEDIRLLVKVARLHYEYNLGQQEIASQLQTSVSSVSRLLKKAKQRGIVEIRIHDATGRIASLEQALKQLYDLEAAIVVQNVSNCEATRTSLGQAVAEHIEMFIQNEMVIGVSDGMTTAAVAAGLRLAKPLNRVEVVPLVGGVGMPDMYTHPAEVARTFMLKVGGVTRQLNAPAMVQDAAIRNALMRNPVIRSVFSVVERCNIAVVGVGSVTTETAMVKNGVMTPEEIAEVKKLGAVGAICARFYDEFGRPIVSDLDDRTISISLAQLKQIKHTIAVAMGADKVEAIRAALRGRIVRVLGTDQATAELLLG